MKCAYKNKERGYRCRREVASKGAKCILHQELSEENTKQKRDAFYRNWLKELRNLFPVLINEGLLRNLELG